MLASVSKRFVPGNSNAVLQPKEADPGCFYKDMVQGNCIYCLDRLFDSASDKSGRECFCDRRCFCCDVPDHHGNRGPAWHSDKAKMLVRYLPDGQPSGNYQLHETED